MRIDGEIKLDFSDVLIRPKRSTLSSRKEVNLNRTFKFKHSGWEWTGIPIMASNMDGVGTFEMAVELYKYNMFTCLVKSYSLDDFINKQEFDFGNYCAVSTGTSDKDWTKLQQILNAFPELHFICIDGRVNKNGNNGTKQSISRTIHRRRLEASFQTFRRCHIHRA